MVTALKPQLWMVLHDRRIELTEDSLPKIQELIAAHEPYTAVAQGTRPLSYLLEGRGPVGYPPARADRFDPEKPGTYVPHAQDEVVLQSILRGRFGLREDEAPGHSHPPQSERPQDPEDDKKVQQIEERARTLRHRDQTLNPGLLERTLEDLRAIGRIAGSKPFVVYHEPHHDLTPGMLLTGELFRRIVADVGSIWAQHAAGKSAGDVGELLGQLQAFVCGLNGIKGSAPDLPQAALGIQYAAFIDREAAGRPTRLEVVLAAGRVVAVSVVVGAWRGGTHSDGSSIHK